MARIRTIKPEFFTSEQVAECSPTARLLFIGMWCFADDRGVHPASTKRLKMEIFPADNLSAEAIQALVEELKKVGLVTEFEAAGERFLHITGWQKHQRIEKPTYRHPEPPLVHRAVEESSRCLRPVDDQSESPRSRIGMDRNGKDIEADPPTPPQRGNGDQFPDDIPSGDLRPRKRPQRRNRCKPDESEALAVVEAWNAIPDVSHVEALTDGRSRKLAALLKKSPFRDRWREALKRVAGSDFCRGRVPPTAERPKPWKADFDWFLKPDTIAKILEGKYDNPAGPTPSGQPTSPTANTESPLLYPTAEETGDPKQFDGWFHRQRTFDHDDKVRAELHAVRCRVVRLFRSPEVASGQLAARLDCLAAGGQPADPPRFEDRDQAAHELARIGGAA